MGPAGIGIALSLVSSAITIYTMYQQKANKALNDTKKTTEDYIATLSQLDQVQVKGAQNAQKELVDLQALYLVATNTTLSLKQRKQAVDELQETYPTYFGNIKDEEILLGNVGDAYNRLTQSIIATAKAEAAKNLITENSKKRLENAQKLIDLEAEQLKNQSKLDAARKRGTVSGGAGIAAVAGSSGQGIAESAKINENLKARIDIAEEINKIDARNLSLTKEITDQVKLGADLTSLKADKKATIKLPKDTKLELPENSQDLVAELYRKISGINAPGALSIELPKKLNITGERVPLQLGDLVDISKIDVEGQKLIEQLEKIAESAKKSIDKTLALPSLVDIAATSLGSSFEAMGAAIADGGNVLVAAGEVLQKSFADLLSALGQQFITMGAAKVAAGILATPFGAKLVADGAGLIALGAGLKLGGGIVGNAGKSSKGSSGGVTAFANGGIISGPTLGLMGEYAGAKSDPEVVAPLSKLKKMLGQTDQNGNPTVSSSQTPVYVQQELRIDGKKLVALIRTVQEDNKRIG